MQNLHDLSSALENALGILEEEEREQAESCLRWSRRLTADSLDQQEQRHARIELARLSELLGRRRTQAMPYAALGRAALAEHHGDTRSRDEFLRRAYDQLLLLGL